MNDREQPRAGMLLQRREQALVGDMLAEFRLHLDDVGPGQARNLGDPAAEEAARADDRGVPGLEQVDQAGLHARHAGRLEREHEFGL